MINDVRECLYFDLRQVRMPEPNQQHESIAVSVIPSGMVNRGVENRHVIVFPVVCIVPDSNPAFALGDIHREMSGEDEVVQVGMSLNA
jgi:hypothetical protein